MIHLILTGRATQSCILLLALGCSVVFAAPLQPDASVVQKYSESDIEVVLARALYFLQTKQFIEARDEATRVLLVDHTQLARYVVGVACNRLEQWQCAAEALSLVRSSPVADTFDDLSLESGIALYHLGELRTAKEQLQRALAGPAPNPMATQLLHQVNREGMVPFFSVKPRVTLSAGVIGNVVGLATNEYFTCTAPNSSSPCSGPNGGYVSEGLSFSASPKSNPFRSIELSYQFLHTGYPFQKELSIYALQDHRFQLHWTGLKWLEAQVVSELVSLNNTYFPLYAILRQGKIGVNLGLAPTIRGAISYRATLEQYSDLATIWAGTWKVSAQDEAVCGSLGDAEASEAGLLCTSNASGVRHSGSIEVKWQDGGRFALIGWDLESNTTASASLQNALVKAWIRGGVGVGDASFLKGSLMGADQVFAGRGWRIQELQALIQGVQVIHPNATIGLDYGLSVSKAELVAENTEQRLYVVQRFGAELTYVY